MSEFLSTSYRNGSIIQARVSAGSGGSPQRGNSYREARLIGQTILSRKEYYLSSIENELATCSGAALKIDDYQITARFDPGLIIDFPHIRLKTNQWELSARTCLTVCAGGSQSKIWSRIVRQIPDRLQAISSTEVAQLNELSRRCSTSLNKVIRLMYQDDFATTLNKDVSLTQVGEVEIFAVDCIGIEISTAIKDYCSLLLWNDGVRSIVNVELADAMRQITDISMPIFAQDGSATAEFALQEKADFVPFRSSRGADSVFIAAADGSRAYVSGLVDAGPDLKIRDLVLDPNLPPSSGATAELATRIGAVY